jgi:hypothetical protein
VELACTIANDTPEAGGNRLMDMRVAMSEVRSPFDGDVVIFRTGEVPIFHLPRVGLYEYDLPMRDGLAGRARAVAVMSADLTERWSKSFAPDESLFGTQLCLIGCTLEDEALPMSSTWTRWPERHQGHPETFCEVDRGLHHALLACPHFLAGSSARIATSANWGCICAEERSGGDWK